LVGGYGSNLIFKFPLFYNPFPTALWLFPPARVIGSAEGTPTFDYLNIMTMKYLLLIILFCLPLRSEAGSGSLSGKVRNPQGKPVTGVVVLVLKAADSALVKTGITDDAGLYLLEDMADGDYLVAVNQVMQPVTVHGEVAAVPDLVMAETREIREVTVRGQKSLIEAKADRIIVNVENSIVNTGSTVLEVLQRSPGVNVDHNDNISLKGKQGVTIMIDGKIVPVQGTDLASILKGMPSNSVEKIELITNPGVRYDAAGNAGIINIITKKDKRKGFNGSATGGYAQGIYPKANAGFNLNYRTKKLNVYTGYNMAYRDIKNELILYRQFDTNKSYQLAYDQHNYARIDIQTHTANAGVDYSLTDRTNIGIMLNAGQTIHNSTSRNAASLLDADRNIFSSFNNTTGNNSSFYNYSANLNLRHSFDSLGRELGVDADYATYYNYNDQHLYTRYKNADGTPKDIPAILMGKMHGKTTIRSLKADYSHPLGSKAKLDAGFKTSFVTADNDPVFYDQSSGVDIYDSSKSNHFIYKEQINALYVNANKEWTKWGVQLGVRAEQTIADGHQLVNDARFEKRYLNFFPNIAVTHHLDAKTDIGLNLSRRIDRPSYRQLNPFKNYLDPTSIHEGNPYLDPSFTYTAELSHIYDGKFITQLGYSQSQNMITEVIAPTAGNITLITNRNLATNTIVTLSGVYPFQVFKWWNSTNYLAAYYTHFRGDIANTSLNEGTFAVSLSSQNSFILPRDWSVELNGWYQSEQRYGYMVLRALSSINIGIQKNLFDKKATLKLGVTDLLYKENPIGYSNFTNYHEDFIVRRDSRMVNISFTYRFGNKAIAPAKKKQRGAEEELRRAG
jgi:hypothetical protein